MDPTANALFMIIVFFPVIVGFGAGTIMYFRGIDLEGDDAMFVYGASIVVVLCLWALYGLTHVHMLNPTDMLQVFVGKDPVALIWQAFVAMWMVMCGLTVALLFACFPYLGGAIMGAVTSMILRALFITIVWATRIIVLIVQMVRHIVSRPHQV